MGIETSKTGPATATAGWWKVGELAQRTGLTVRTLHHYDRIGLLRPSQRGVGRHRLYSDADVARLLEIKCLRQLGFKLEDVRRLLDDPGHDARSVIRLHAQQLREQIRRQQKLCRRLDHVVTRLGSRQRVTVKEFLDLIKEIAMTETFEKYYTPEQLEELRQRAATLGPDRIRKAEEDWRALIREVRDEMNKGSDPAREPVLSLARRWRALIEVFTGGNQGIAASLSNMYRQEGPAVAQQHGMDLDGAMMKYMGRALAAPKTP